MARTVVEWVGKTDDTKAPPRICQRVFDRANGICHFCGQPIQKPHQAHETDHIKALINGGENRESNLAPIHKSPCHKIKTGIDVAAKKKTAAMRQKHIGVAAKKRQIQSPGFPPSPKSQRPARDTLPPRAIYRSAS